MAGVCEVFGDEGTPCHPNTSCLRVPGGAMSVEVSDDYFVITEVEKVKVWREIGRTGGDRRDLNVMNDDWDIVDEVCDKEVLDG